MRAAKELVETIIAHGGHLAAFHYDPGSDSDPEVLEGAFGIKSDQAGQAIQVIFSNGMGWDHASACVRNKKGPVRTPSYTEMKRIKAIVFKDTETAIEYHMPAADHININPHVLHLWRPQNTEIPKPPAVLV